MTYDNHLGIVIEGANTIASPAFPVPRVVDTTGAGDLFAAGFLFGLASGAGHSKSAQLGALAASEVISHIGARPEVPLEKLAQDRGLLA